MAENVYHHEINISKNKVCEKNLFYDFPMRKLVFGEDVRYEFDSLISKNGSQCVLVLPKAQFIDSPRNVWVILDQHHAISVHPKKVSPWVTSSSNSRAVLLSRSDFIPTKIRYDVEGFASRGFVDDKPDVSRLMFDFWKNKVDNSPYNRPWVNVYGWLYL